MGASRNGSSSPSSIKPQEIPEGERGYSGSEELYAHYTPLSDPLSTLRPKAADFTRMLDRDGTGQALDYALTLPIRQGMPYLEPHPEDKGEAEFIRRILFASAAEGGMTTPMGDVIAQMSTGITHRFAAFEKVPQTVDGMVTLKKLAYRPAERITIRRDRNGSFNGYRERGERSNDAGLMLPMDEKFDPAKVFVYFHGGNRRPSIGESALEAAYRHHSEKINILKLSNESLQNHALSILIGTHGPRAKKDKRWDFFEALKNIRGGGRMVKAPDEQVESLNQKSDSEEFRLAIAYHDQQMVMSCLVQFLMLGGSNTGSWALSRDHSDFFTMSEESRREEIAQSLTNHVIAQLVALNFPSPKFPKLRFLPLSDTERTRALEVWRQLVTSSVQRVHKVKFDALEQRALQAIGIDAEELMAKAGTDDNGEDPNDVTKPEGAGDGSDANGRDGAFKRSLDRINGKLTPGDRAQGGARNYPGGPSS